MRLVFFTVFSNWVQLDLDRRTNPTGSGSSQSYQLKIIVQTLSLLSKKSHKTCFGGAVGWRLCFLRSRNAGKGGLGFSKDIFPSRERGWRFQLVFHICTDYQSITSRNRAICAFWRLKFGSLPLGVPNGFFDR